MNWQLVNYKKLLENLPEILDENQEYMIIVEVSKEDKKTVQKIEVKKVNWLTRVITKIEKSLTRGKIYHFENDAFQDLTAMIKNAADTFTEWSQKKDDDLKDKNIKQLLKDEKETYRSIHDPLMKFKHLFDHNIAQNFHRQFAHFENMHHAAESRLKTYDVLQKMKKALTRQGGVTEDREEEYFDLAKKLFELKEFLLREKLVCEVSCTHSGKMDQDYLDFLETYLANIDQEKEAVMENMKSIILKDETRDEKVQKFENFPDVHQQLKNAKITRPLVKSLQKFKRVAFIPLSEQNTEHQVSLSKTFIENGYQVLASYRDTSKDAPEESDKIKQEFDDLNYTGTLAWIFRQWKEKLQGENKLPDDAFVANLEHFVAFIQMAKEKERAVDVQELRDVLKQGVQELEELVHERASALCEIRRNEAHALEQVVEGFQKSRQKLHKHQEEYAEWQREQYSFLGSNDLQEALNIDDEFFTKDDETLIANLQQEILGIKDEETLTTFLDQHQRILMLTQLKKRTEDQMDKLRERSEYLNSLKHLTIEQQAKEMDNTLTIANVIKKELGIKTTKNITTIKDLDNLLKKVRKKPFAIISAIAKVPGTKEAFIKLANGSNDEKNLFRFIQELKHRARQFPWDPYGYYRMPDKDLYEQLFTTLKELGYSEPQPFDKLTTESLLLTAAKAINPHATDEDIQEMKSSLTPKIEKVQAIRHVLSKRRQVEKEQQESQNTLKTIGESYKRLNDFNDAVSTLIQASENLSLGKELSREMEKLEQEITSRQAQYDDATEKLKRVEADVSTLLTLQSL